MRRDAEGDPSGDAVEARYANYSEIGHNAFEVMLDFGQHYERENRPRMHTRIAAAPAFAKSLHALLGSVIVEYEKVFGEIVTRSEHE